MIKTIVTPIDGSANAQSALDLSIDLAARYDAQLVLLHVGVRDDKVPKGLYETASRELGAAEGRGQETGGQPHHSKHLQALEYMGHTLLRSAQEQAEGKDVKRVETVADVGDAAERIVHHAK